jgi:hypothetical protein
MGWEPMIMSKPDKSFAKKFNLLGRGEVVKVSQRIDERVKALQRRGADIKAKGEEYSKVEKRLFGGLPLPGEPGYSNYFKEI